MLKKLVVSTLFIAASTLKIADAYQLPKDRDGVAAGTVEDVGVHVFLSTSSLPWLLNGSTQTLAGGTIVNTSSIAIYGVLTSSFSGDIGAPAYVHLRATNTANTTSELLTTPIAVGITTSTTGTFHVARNNLVLFRPPLVVPDGVSVNISSTPGSLTTNQFSAAVFYRYLATNAPEDVWFPNDDNGIKTIGGASLYGVKPATGNTLGGIANDGLGNEALDFTTDARFIQTSSVPANQAPVLLYGWSASSGALSSSFDIDAATGSGNYRIIPNVVTANLSFLPVIYPRTLENYSWGTIVPPTSVTTNSDFNFPWPLISPRGIRFQASVSTEMFRLKTRNARALR